MTKQFTEDEILHTLAAGEVREEGLLPYSSNHSFLVSVRHGEVELPAVYKPQWGENPLWDFAEGSLCRRETAAYVISAELGWDLVPPTVLREATRGLGSIQFYVSNDEERHYFTVCVDARYALSMRKLALFDHVINNADRKSGHCLIGHDERMWAIDHGICFHVDPKLRSVIWEFSRQPIEEDLLDALRALADKVDNGESRVATSLAQLLTADEVQALRDRLLTLLETQTYPAPSPFRRNYPWPPI